MVLLLFIGVRIYLTIPLTSQHLVKWRLVCPVPRDVHCFAHSIVLDKYCVQWGPGTGSGPVNVLRQALVGIGSSLQEYEGLVADVIADWKATSGAVGIRIMIPADAEREPDDPGLDRILRAAVRHDLPVNTLCWGNLDVGAALFARRRVTSYAIGYNYGNQ